jgi:hypothetical protein
MTARVEAVSCSNVCDSDRDRCLLQMDTVKRCMDAVRASSYEDHVDSNHAAGKLEHS